MSGDMLTNLLNETTEVKPKTTFHDFYIKRWESEVACDCDIKTSEGECRLTAKYCNYYSCYRRSTFHVNY